MTQTIEEKARELLAKHYESSGTHHYAEQLRNDHQRQPQAIAALTEALTRIEELEGALRPFAEIGHELNGPSWRDREVHWQASAPYKINVGHLRAAHRALTKGIKE